MPSGFDRLLEIGDKINYGHNAQAATFAYNNLVDEAAVTVIFESSKEIIVVQGETEVVTRRPVASIDHKQLEEKALPFPQVKDQLTVEAKTYDIVAVPDDGHNETEMHLELV